MNAEIKKKIESLEEQHGVVCLLAVESGSRLWGFASPDSDYDVRGVFVRPTHDYLRISPKRDVIVDMDNLTKLDIQLWDIRKFFAYLAEGKFQAREWLNSHIIYQVNHRFLNQTLSLSSKSLVFGRIYRAYLGLARQHFLKSTVIRDIFDESEFQEEYHLKPLLYSVRGFLAARYVFDYELFPPLNISDLAKCVHITHRGDHYMDELREELRELIKLKQRTNERMVVNAKQCPKLLQFIEQEFQLMDHYRPAWGTEIIRPDYLEFDRLVFEWSKI